MSLLTDCNSNHFRKNICSLKHSWSQCFLCQNVKSMFENSDEIVKSGLIFVDQAKVINDFPTKINQDIKFVDMQTWKVYEHYKINKRTTKNQLGFFNSAFQYVSLINTAFVERRSDFQEYHMIAMTEFSPPFIHLDLSSAMYDETSDTFDVTKSAGGMCHEMFLIMQKCLNFTATLKKRKDGKWGPTTVLANGSIITDGIVKSVTTGFGEMIVASYVAR